MRTEEEQRKYARRLRDRQWAFMEKMAAVGTLWYCNWNKSRRDEADDEIRDGLLSSIPLLDWIDNHKDWFIEGEWDEAREAFPFQLTPAGHLALTQRDRYDLEPVRGGLVSPGWEAMPEAREEETIHHG